jgi:HSP20 family molecular chaperone IbpA
MLRNTEMQTADKASVPAVPEQTYHGPVYTPAVDIFESEDTITLLADMPGLKAQDLKIDLRENVLTLSGHVPPPEAQSESNVLSEYAPGTYFRQFTLSEMIDQAKIAAKMTDGVLRLDLPKAERAKPRQIVVKSS